MDNKAKYSLLTYLFLLLTVFMIFTFTKSFYTSLVENRDKIKILNEQIKTKKEEYDKIARIKSQIDSWAIKDINFNKFLANFSEDELLEYFYSYASNHPSNLKIESLKLTEWKLNEFWLKESKIDLVVTFNTEQDMIDMINFLLKSEKYNLYIHEFSYPFWSNTPWPIKVTIPLKVLHK